MIPPICGNDTALRLIRTMRKNDRLPHACLIYGEKGSGRKTIARYFAMTALCTGSEAPCGVCNSCKKLLLDDLAEIHPHPDVIWAPHSGKLGGFSVETVRGVCRDAIVAPNDTERKVYLFADCDAMDIRAQNTLLKLTEEPPAHVLLLFTAVHRNVFLETMRSRMMMLPTRLCTPEECRETLIRQHSIAPADADRAVTACGGNIGRALAWLEDEDMQTLTRNAAALTAAAAGHRQYEILRIFAQYEKDRQGAYELLRLLDLQLRDAVTMQYTSECLGCDRDSAAGLSLSAGRAVRLHEAVQNAYEAIGANVSVKLALAALGGALLS